MNQTVMALKAPFMMLTRKGEEEEEEERPWRLNSM